MVQPPTSRVTLILQQIEKGDRSALHQLLPLIYEDLRVMARRMYRGNAGNRTLNPTALVHEAYGRLVGQSGEDYENRSTS